jgi:hypothetical protein
MSFSCPHYDFANDGSCMRLTKPCVPGRPGCVLRQNSHFLVPVEVRLDGESGKPVPPEAKRPGGEGCGRAGPF